MMIAWLTSDAALEALNQRPGIVRLAGPASFVIGPLVAVGAGWALGLRARVDWLAQLPWRSAAACWSSLSRSCSPIRWPRQARVPTSRPSTSAWAGTAAIWPESARVFSPTDPVVAAARFDPPILRGATITIRMTRDGALVTTYPVVQVADEPWPCVYGEVAAPPLTPGVYRWSIEVSGSAMPPLAGEFTVAG